MTATPAAAFRWQRELLPHNPQWQGAGYALCGRPHLRAPNPDRESGARRHTFRRLNITWRQEAGATPFEAQIAAGQAKPDTTWLYTITDDERERAHVERIWNRVTGKTAGTVQ